MIIRNIMSTLYTLCFYRETVNSVDLNLNYIYVYSVNRDYVDKTLFSENST